jgi:hypothetical protein
MTLGRCCTLALKKKFPRSKLRENEESGRKQAVETVTVASETTMAKLWQVETLIMLVFQSSFTLDLCAI